MILGKKLKGFIYLILKKTRAEVIMIDALD